MNEEDRNQDQIKRNKQLGVPSYKITVKRYQGGNLTIVNYDDRIINYIDSHRFNPENSKAPQFCDMVICPYCQEPRYWERLISYHIVEKHPERLKEIEINNI